MKLFVSLVLTETGETPSNEDPQHPYICSRQARGYLQFTSLFCWLYNLCSLVALQEVVPLVLSMVTSRWLCIGELLDCFHRVLVIALNTKHYCMWLAYGYWVPLVTVSMCSRAAEQYGSSHWFNICAWKWILVQIFQYIRSDNYLFHVLTNTTSKLF